jgi:hypothetical protein
MLVSLVQGQAEILKHPNLATHITDEFAELLVKAGEGGTNVLARISKWDSKLIEKFASDLKNSKFSAGIAENPELVDAWGELARVRTDIIPDALRRNPNFIRKFDDLAKNNSLGLDADGISDLLSSPAAKGQVWDNPDALLDAIKRGADANIDGLSISHKKFPAPSEGNESFVLKNAKQYQKEASGDAALSFDINGTSWDNIDVNGKLVDRKYGHGASMFKEVDDGFGEKIIEVTNNSRVTSSLDQAARQVSAAVDRPIKWEISIELGAKGLRQVFSQSNDPLIRAIEVVYVPQVIIIP